MCGEIRVGAHYAVNASTMKIADLFGLLAPAFILPVPLPLQFFIDSKMKTDIVVHEQR